MATTIKLWTCPKCGRQFARKNQSHSCKTFPLQKHFKGKEKGKLLFDNLIRSIKKTTGSFKIDSVECCVHLVNVSTFVAVKVMKDKIRIDFTLPHKIKKQGIASPVKLSPHRYLYFVDVTGEKDINAELMGWIKEAYYKSADYTANK